MSIELDTDDPRVTATMNRLALQLSQYVGTDFNLSVVGAMETIVSEHRASFKRDHGYEFPNLRSFVLPSARLILFYRADLEDQQIHDKLLTLLRQLGKKGIRISAMEVAAAVKRTWPRYRPPIETMRKNPRLIGQLQ